MSSATIECKMAPAPRFDLDLRTGVSLATIYAAHYDRLVAVLDAARTGNLELIKMAVEKQDRFGSSDGRRAA